MEKKEIIKICKKYGIKNYTINDDGSIDVDGHVDLWDNDFDQLPLVFNKVSGGFACDGTGLTTLKGSPRWVGSSFECGYNNLTSLEFSPEYVGCDFHCEDNDLTDNYCETKIEYGFYTTLKQDGLTINHLDEATNYNEWRRLYKRKKILNKLFEKDLVD